MAGFQTQLGHFGEAQRWIQEARRRDPVDAYIWFDECIGFLNLGDVQSAKDCARQLGTAYPEKLVSDGIWTAIHAYQGEWNAAITTLEFLSERIRGWRTFERWLADWTAGQGDVERGRRRMADTFPELLEDGLEIAVPDLHAAVTFAAILNANGETQRRDVLLLAAQERIATMHRIRGIGYGIVDVYIHAMQGDRERAIAGLREAIDMGWRVSDNSPRDSSWWMIRQDWKLASLHQDPEFIAMMDELEADIAQQCQWFEEHKDDPLF
jgi:hypothetical protein